MILNKYACLSCFLASDLQNPRFVLAFYNDLYCCLEYSSYIIHYINLSLCVNLIKKVFFCLCSHVVDKTILYNNILYMSEVTIYNIKFWGVCNIIEINI